MVTNLLHYLVYQNHKKCQLETFGFRGGGFERLDRAIDGG